MQDQLTIPMTVDSLIPENHVVRMVNRAIDQMNLEPLLAKYPGGGRSSFNPVMMTKLLVYAYTDKIFSCRRIAKAARENFMYMWLCGGNKPDFMAVNRFRSERMKDVILEVFAEVVLFRRLFVSSNGPSPFSNRQYHNFSEIAIRNNTKKRNLIYLCDYECF